MTDRLRQPGPMRRFAVVGMAAAVLLAAASVAVAAPVGTPRAWFDAPLPGATLPLASYPVVVHAADDSGVAKVRFQVDGVPAGTQAPNKAADLVLITWTWTPESLGPHLLTAVAEGNDGSLSDPVSVGVTIAEGARSQPTPDISPEASPSGSGGASATPRASGATPGPTPTPPTTPAPTRTPTATPCALIGPNLVMPYAYEQIAPAGNPPLFEWTNPDQPCPVAAYHLVVSMNFDLSSPIVSEQLANDTFFWPPPDPLPAPNPTCLENEYYWTVYAVDINGIEYVLEQSVFYICP